MKLFLGLLFALFAVSVAQVTCGSFSDCNTCVSTASQGQCGWCRSNSRCLPGDSTGSTPLADCANPSSNWIFGGASKLLNQFSGFPVNPVHFNVYLYPNSPLNLVVTVTNPLTDTVPLDLYIIEDLSGSMGDDVLTFFSLSRYLTVDVLRYQSNPRFGLGSFAERPTLPVGLDPWTENGNTFSWPDAQTQFATNALATCPTRTTTSGPFNWNFCHELPLTDAYNQLTDTIGRFVTHVNGDWPENQMDALLYSAVCDMQWRPGARRVVLVATDANYHTPYNLANTSGINFVQENDYLCTQELGFNGVTAGKQVPGCRENYPDPNRVAALISAANIVPVIASAKALPDHNDLPEWQRTINGWGFGKVLELASDSSNLIALIRQALAELATVMVMTLCVTGCDPQNQVQSFSPIQGYTNVAAGDQRFFQIILNDRSAAVVPSTISFSVVGFGDVTINVTNQIPCLGCDGSNDPSIVVDLCGECNGNNLCLGCDGQPYSGAQYDECGICNGASDSCYDCLGIQWGNTQYDACFECDGDNSTCTDCAGTIHPPGEGGAANPQNNPNFLRNDECNVCGGNGSSCRGCDGLINSTKVKDNCDVCGGDNSSCVAILPPPPSEVPTIVAGATAGIVFAVIAIIAIIAIVAALGKKKWDKMQYMQNQAMTALGSSPLYENTGGWQQNMTAN